MIARTPLPAPPRRLSDIRRDYPSSGSLCEWPPSGWPEAPLLPKTDIPPDITHVVFVLTEFQIADKETAQRNESGASSHEAYKARQHERVRMRLFRDKDDPLSPD